MFGGISGSGVGDIVAFVKLSGAEKFTQDIDKLNQKVNNAGASLNKVMNVALLAGAAAFTASVIAAAKFEEAMRNVNSISQLSEEQFRKQGQEVISLSKKFPQSAVTLAKGLYDIASSGFQGADGLKVLEAAAKAASAGMTTTAVSAKGITAVLNAYGLSADEAGKVSDIMFRTVDKGVITFEELSSTVGDWIGMGKAAGLEFNELSGAVAYMTTQGINASAAGVSLQRILTGFVKPSEAMAVAIREAGFESGEMMLKSVGLTGAMEMLNKTTGGSITKMLELMPEIRGVRGANALLGAGYEELTKYMEDFKDTTDATDIALKEQSKSFAYQANLLKNNVTAAFIEMGQVILPVLNDMFKLMNKQPAVFGAVIKVAGTLAITFGALAGVAKLINIAQTTMNTLQSAWLALKLKEHFASFAGTIRNTQVAQDLMTGSMGAQILKAGLLAGAIAFASYNIVNLISAIGDYIESTKKLKESDDLWDELNETILENNRSFRLVQAELNMMSSDTLVKLNGEVISAGDAMKRMYDIQAMGLETIEGSTILPKMTLETGNYTKAMIENQKAAQKVADEQKRLDDIQAKFKKANIETTKSIKDQIEQLEELYWQAKAIGDDYVIKKIEEDLYDLGTQIGNTSAWDRLVGSQLKMRASMASLSSVTGSLEMRTKNLNDKFKESNDKVITLNEALFGYKTIEEALNSVGLKTNEQIANEIKFYEGLLEVLPKTENAYGIIVQRIEELKDGTDKGGVSWTEYARTMGQIIDRIPGLDENIKSLAKSAIEIVTSGFNPLVIALNVVTLLFGIFGGSDKEVERIMLTVDDLLDLMGELGERIRETTEFFDDFQKTFDSKIISIYEKQLEDLLVDLAFLESFEGGITMKAFYEYFKKYLGLTEEELENANLTALWQEMLNTINESIADIEEILEKFKEAFDFRDTYEFQLSAIRGFVEESMRMFELFGADYPGMEAVLILLQEQIDMSKELLKTLDPTSQAYQDLAKSILEAELAMMVMKGQYGSLEEAQLAQQRAAYIMLEALRNQLAQMDESSPYYQQTIDDIARWEERLKMLSDMLGDANPYLSEHEVLLRQLADAGIETEQSVRDEIAAYEALLPKVAEGSYEYQQLQDKLSELYEKLGETSPYDQQIAAQEAAAEAARKQAEAIAELQGKINDTIAQIDDYKNQIAELEQQKIQIDLELRAAIIVEEEKIAGLEDIGARLRDALSSGDTTTIDFFAISKEIESLTGQVQRLTIDWGAMLDEMFIDYGGFESDLKAANEAIEQLLYFKIDLDTTGADEQINAAIFKMQDYLKTLTPGSQAYIDAQAGLNQLIEKFTEMGGTLDEEAAIKFNIEQAEQSISDVEGMIDDLNAKAEEEKAVIDADISAAQIAIEGLTLALNNFLKQLYELMIGADTTKADQEIGNIKTDIDNLSSIIPKVNVDVNDGEIDTAISKIKYQVASTPKVNVDVNDGEIDTAINKINLIPSVKTVKILVTYTISGPVPAGLVQHEGGLVKAHEGMLIDAHDILTKAHAGMYAGRREVPILALEGEYVMRPAVTDMFGEDRMNMFNATLNPEVLRSGRQSKQNIVIENKVDIHNAMPETWAEITNKVIDPQIRINNQNTKTVEKFR